MKKIHLPKRFSYILILFIFSLGTFGMFSNLEANIFLKYYGLIIFVQGGFFLTYLSFYKLR